MYTFRVCAYNRAGHDEHGEITELIQMWRVEPVRCDVLYSANGAAIIGRKFNGEEIRYVMPSTMLYETKQACADACAITNAGLEKQDPDMLTVIEKVRKLNSVNIDAMCEHAAQEIVAAVGGDKLKLNRAQRRLVERTVKR